MEEQVKKSTKKSDILNKLRKLHREERIISLSKQIRVLPFLISLLNALEAIFGGVASISIAVDDA